MIIEVKKDDIYIPVYNKNREAPEDEQLRVHHRFFTPEERKKYIYTLPMKANKLTGEMNWDVEYIQDERGIVKALVTKFENFVIQAGKTKTTIKNGVEMYSTQGVPQKLVTEIESAMLMASPEVDKDFLPQPSPST